VKHLHDDRQLASFQVEGIIKPRNDWGYLIFWGVSGVALGSLMPWVDLLWEDSKRTSDSEKRRRKISGEEEKEIDSTRLFGGDWTPVIRSVGAFVGIAFAIVSQLLPTHLLKLTFIRENFPGHRRSKSLLRFSWSTRFSGT
jgi:hypothetical protein